MYIPWFYAEEIVAIENNTNIFVIDENTPVFSKKVLELRPRTRDTLSRCLKEAGMEYDNSLIIPPDEQIYKEPDAILKILNSMAYTVGLVFTDAGKESMPLPLKKARYIEGNLYEIEMRNPYYEGRKKVIEIALDNICMKKDMTYILHSVTFLFDEKPVPLFSRIGDGLGNGYKRIRLSTNYLIRMVKLTG